LLTYLSKLFGLSGREFQWLEQNLELEHGCFVSGRIHGIQQEDRQGAEIASGSYHCVLVVLRRRDFEGRVEQVGRLQLFCVSSSHGEDYNCCCSTISGFSSNALSCRTALSVRESQTAKNLSSTLLSEVAGEENAEAPGGFMSGRVEEGK
jgi:hypothetical protein